MSEENEFIVALSGVRHVRTPEGAKFYGEPIGSPITKDVIAMKKALNAAKGILPPKGGLTSHAPTTQFGKGEHVPGSAKKIGMHADNMPGGKNYASILAHRAENEKKFGKPGPDGLPQVNHAGASTHATTSPSTLTGPKKFNVGGTPYEAPEGSKLVKPKGLSNVAFVVTPDGQVHAFNHEGEAQMDPSLQQIFSKKFAGDLSNDPDYDTAQFDTNPDENKSHGDISKLPAGQALTDAEGHTQFIKQDDGTWKHAALGVPVNEADLKDLYDSGNLIAKPGAKNYKDMASNDVVSELDAKPVGTKMGVDNGTGKKVTIEKLDNGKWKLGEGDNAPDLPSVSVAVLKEHLSDGEPAPEDKYDPNNPPNPADATAATGAPNPLDLNSPEGPQSGDKVTPEWVDSAKVGAQFNFKSPNSGKDTVWTKTDKNQWSAKGVSGNNVTIIDSNVKGLLGDNVTVKSNDGNTPDTHTPEVGAPSPDTPSTDAKIGTNYKPSDHVYDPNGTGTDALPNGVPEGSTKIDESGLDSVPVGGTVYVQSTTGSFGFIKDKNSTAGQEAIWHDNIEGMGLVWGQSDILKKNKGIYLAPKEDKASASKAAGPDASQFTEGMILNSGDDLSAFKDGTIIDVADEHGNPDFSIVKQDGKWYEDLGQPVEDKQLKGLLDEGYLSFGSHPANPDSASVDAVTSMLDNALSDAEKADAASKVTHSLKNDANAKKIGGQAGSNEGGLYELPMSDGTTAKYYVKKAQTKDHGNNEALANDLYIALGVNAPAVDHAADGNIYSKIVDGKHDMNDHLNDPKWLDKVRRDFAIDAWLSNRDVFGLTNDNILTDKNGDPWRIDNGGALKYRAQGEPKTDFGNVVTELDVFRNGKKAKVFGPGMTKEQELDGVNRILALHPNEIKKMVADHGMDSSMADTLIARRENIAKYYGLDLPENQKSIINEPKANLPEVKPLAVGDKIKGESALSELAPGTNLLYHKKSGGSTAYKISGNGDLVTNKGTHVDFSQAKGMEFEVAGIPDSKANAPEVSTPEVNTPAVHAPSAPEVNAPSANAPSVTGPGDLAPGLSFSKDEIQAAINGLEAHSGFQIKYGLPKDSPLQGEIAPISTAAKKDFPDLSPKQAFIAHLKKSIGAETPAAAKADSNNEDASINIGSANPTAKSVQGYDGGKFTPQDVQDAIDILEKFQGKAFKAELNKKGNALGKLDPNQIVGFDKDKTVTKQKFIDLLKQKIDNHKASAPAAPEAPAKQKDWTPDDDVTFADLAQFEAGDMVGQDYPSPWPLTKQADGTWTAPDGATVNEVTLKAVLQGGGSYQGKKAESTPDGNGEFTGFGVADANVLDGLAAGDKVSGMPTHSTDPSESVTFIKKENGKWAGENGNNYSADALVLQFKDLKHEEGAGAKVTSVDELSASPAGSTLVFHSVSGVDHTFTKGADGEWSSPTQSATMTDDEWATSISKGKITDLKAGETTPSTPETAGSPFVAPTAPSGLKAVESDTELDGYPTGTVIQIENTDGEPIGIFTKDSEGFWEENNHQSSATSQAVKFQNAMDDNRLSVVSNPDDIGPITKMDLGKSEFNGGLLHDKDILDSLPTGSVVIAHLPVGDKNHSWDYTKEQSGAWSLTENGTTSTISAGELAEVYSSHGGHLEHKDAPTLPKFTDDKNSNTKVLADLPAGSILSTTLGTSGNTWSWEKDNNGIWHKDSLKSDDKKMAEMFDGSELSVQSVGSGHSDLNTYEVGDTFEPDITNKDTLAPGDMIKAGPDSNVLFVKQADGSWKWTDGEQGFMPVQSPDTVDHVIKNGGIYAGNSLSDSENNNGDITDLKVGGYPTGDQIPNLKVGTKLSDYNGIVYKKTGQDEWVTDPSNGEFWPDEDFIQSAENGQLNVVSLPEGNEPDGKFLPKGQQIKSMDEVKNAPIGQWVTHTPVTGEAYATHYQKTGPDEWSSTFGSQNQVVVIGDENFKGSIADGHLTASENPNGPSEVHPADANLTPAPEMWPTPTSNAAVNALPIGTVLQNTNGVYFSKDSAGSWHGYDPADGSTWVVSPGTIASVGSNGNMKYPKQETPFPGKYQGNGKAYMVVKEDGSGVYVAATGTTTKMTADKVKKNLEAGMAKYKGQMDAPEVGAPSAKKPAEKKTPLGKVELADGVYHGGSGNTSLTYTVKGDEVTVETTKNGLSDTKTVPLDKIKTAFWGGKITDSAGNSILPKGHSGPLLLWNEPNTTIGLADLKKGIEAGEFDNFFNVYTQSKLKKLGVNINSSVLKNKIQTDNNLDWVNSYTLNYSDETHPYNIAAKEFLTKTLDNVLKDANLETPEGGANDLFDWESEGIATMPAPIAALGTPYLYNNADITNYVNTVKAQFGDGKIIGQVAMDKYAKQNWIKAFQDGDFKKMYAIEVGAAADKGKVLPQGYKHPGFTGNESTHKVAWGAAVKGETPAGVKIDGEWSQVQPQQWSEAEVNNYLIGAHMQNPEFLSLTEKKNWVTYHKNGNKALTDQLSATALTRKNSGSDPLTETPVWTDSITPAKAYDYMFDSGPFPTSGMWKATPYEVTAAWAKDNWSDPVFQSALDEVHAQDSYYTKPSGPDDVTPGYVIEAAVAKAWDQKHEAYLEELAKPKYELVDQIAEGSHEVWFVKDQFDRKYVFKPHEADRKWRSEMEDAANKMGNLFGFGTAQSKIVTIGDKEGLIQDFHDTVTDFRGPDGTGLDLTTLNKKQIGQMAAEHVLDWMLDNDDTHAANLMIKTDGNIVGIDKGRGFVHYGLWKGLSGDSKAHSNIEIAYTKLYDGIRDGSISKEQADAAYLAAKKAAARIQKVNPAAVEDLIRQGMQNRTGDMWNKPDYAEKWGVQPVPANVEQLLAEFEKRRSSLGLAIDDMWQKIYADAGLELPQPPAKALGEEHLSGWGEADLLDKVQGAKVWGAAPVHASSAIDNGSSLLWTEKNTTGDLVHKGKFHVGGITQKKILAFLQPKATSVGGITPQTVQNWPTQHLVAWKKSFTTAGKEVSAKAIDKNFDQDIIDLFHATQANITKDLEHWDPSLGNGLEPDDMVDFPSGASVPVEALGQYKLALLHHQEMGNKVQAAIDAGEKTDKAHFTAFTPIPFKAEHQTITNAETGASYKELNNGQWLYSDGHLVEYKNLPPEVLAGEGGWKSENTLGSAKVDSTQYFVHQAGDYAGTLSEGGEKTITNSLNSSGHGGQEYEVHLPTGEVVNFRNSSSTNTLRSQQGRLQFTLSGSDRQASLSRVEDFLSQMGLDMSGANEDSAQTVYWRAMFNRVLMSKGHSGTVLDARNKLLAKKAELAQKVGEPVNEYNLVEALGLSMEPDEEQQFWHDLAVQAWGAEKVNNFIGSGKHMPKYHHMDLTDTEKATGQHYFERIDVDPNDVLKQNTLLAIGNSSKDDGIMKYITSGGMLSTEERLRILGHFKQGASSGSDQGVGGANSVFTRVATPGSSVEKYGNIYGDHVAYWNPSVMAEVGTYSYAGDQFGNLGEQMSGNDINPKKALKYSGTGNETMVSNSLSIADHLEIMVFENATKRDLAIQKMKQLGFSTLRGVPIEDRFVMRANLTSAMQKVKAAWTTQ